MKLTFNLQWVLRVTTALCFIGHGAWGVITKAGWVPLFTAVGIPEDIAWQLMPVIGVVDIIAGLSILVYPTRVILVWMLLWATWTALLRPISGTPGPWEFFERAGNIAPPLMLLVLSGSSRTLTQWFTFSVTMTEARLRQVFLIGRIAVALLLIGHGAFGAFVHKQLLIDHWASVGIAIDLPMLIAIGWFEILLGVLVFVFPIAPLLWFVLVWKLLTEFLYVTHGGPLNIFEFVERAGDYGLPIAMLLVLSARKRAKR